MVSSSYPCTFIKVICVCISRLVVEGKTLLDQIREQLANVE